MSMRLASAGAAAGTAFLGTLFWAASKPSKEAEPSLGFRAQTIGEAYINSLQTGDLVFFTRPRASKDPLSFVLNHLAKAANGGDFEHVGVVVRHPVYHYPYVLERTWRGPALTTFEDRVLHSSCSEIMVRSFHFLRNHEQETAAQAHVGRALAEQAQLRQQPWRLVGCWLRDVASLAFARVAQAGLPRASPPVRRIVDMDELTRLGAGATADITTAAGGTEAFSHDGVGTKVLSGDEAHVENRVSLAGELAVITKQFRSTEADLAPLVSATSAGAGAAAQPALSAQEQEKLLLLLKRRKFLVNSISTLYHKYRAATAQRLFSVSPLSPLASPLVNPLFRDANLVANVLQTLAVLPVPRHVRDGAASAESTVPAGTVLTRAAFEAAFPALVPRQDETPEAAATLDTAAIARVLADFAPEACEYHPHNLRESSYLFVTRGVPGAEQLVVESYRKPPWEVRTGRGGTGDDDEDAEFPLAFKAQ